MLFMETRFDYWREMLLMLVMAIVILLDVFVFDSFQVTPMQPRQHAAGEMSSRSGGAR